MIDELNGWVRLEKKVETWSAWILHPGAPVWERTQARMRIRRVLPLNLR